MVKNELPGNHGENLKARRDTLSVNTNFLRYTVLGLSLLVLASVLIAWLILRYQNETAATPENRVSILDVEIDEPEFQSGSTATQLLDLAEREVQTLLREFPDSDGAYNVKANRDYLISDTAGAKAAWTKATELEPTSADGLFGLALLAFEENEYGKAIAICEDVMRMAPGNPRVPLLLADAFLHDGKADKAALILEQHIASDQSSVQALEMLGNAHLGAQRFQRAAESFQSAIGFSPDSKDAHYGMAQALSRLGNRSEANKFLKRFEEIAKKTSEEHSGDAKAFEDRAYAAHVAAQVYVDSAILYKSNNDLKKAADCLLRAYQLQPNVVGWLEELQRTYFMLGETRAAIDVGEKLVSLEPESVDQWLNLAHLKAEAQLTEPAIAAYREAIRLSPEDPRCQQASNIIRSLSES